MKYFFLLLLIIIGINANAQSDQRAKAFNIDKGLAVSGFDVVAYFTQNKARDGKTFFYVESFGALIRLCIGVHADDCQEE